MATVRLFVHADGRVLPEDPEAANQFPPDAENVAEDPGPVPPLDSPIRAEWDARRAQITPAAEPAETDRRPRGRPRQ